MPLDLFGFRIEKKPDEMTDKKSVKSFVAPDNYDGAFTVEAGGILGTHIDFAGSMRDENTLINRYRSMAMYPEVDNAVEDIVNDSIILGTDKKPVYIELENVELSENIKNKIELEYNNVIKLLNFKNKAYDIYRRWYIDSKLFYHIVIDNEKPHRGIQELRPIDPVKIKKIKKIEKGNERQGNAQIPVVKKVEEFYIYTNIDKNSAYQTTSSGLKIQKDSILYTHSGVIDSATKRVVGYLQKAIRPINMLRQIEDAVVIYRISRAPERRLFYIDVGNLPKQKAEQYIKSLMNRYRNKMVYDANTGEMRDDRNHLHMLEDYWLPRREGGRGTEISTLDGGQNLGEMEDVEYLLKKVYRSLNVPVSRMEADNGFNMGRSAEITRDEVKFYKFIERLRTRFSDLFLQLLKTQLFLKGIITEEDWKQVYQDISFKWHEDSYFSELKQTEIMKERLDLLSTVDEYIGRYYSTSWVRKNILNQTEEEIKMIDSQISEEKSAEENMGMEQEQEQEMEEY
ncbi:portal protein [archaeon]|jgi:hypothetical protein|nr:portal protein [archaeon]